MDQWNGQQRAFAIKMFYKNNDSSKVPVFLCHLVYSRLFNIYDFQTIQLTTGCSECVLFVSQGVPVTVNQLEDVYSSLFHIYDFRPIQLMTGCSERVVFVSRGVPVTVKTVICLYDDGASCRAFCYCVLCALNYA